MTRKQFLALTPRRRGYAVYMLGEREDFPGVPNEPNPYPRVSRRQRAWDAGNFAAMLDAQDGEM